MGTKASVYVDGRFIVLRVSRDYDYEISMNQVQSEEDVEMWAEHLSEKNWCTMPMIDRFKHLARKHNGLA